MPDAFYHKHKPILKFVLKNWYFKISKKFLKLVGTAPDLARRPLIE